MICFLTSSPFDEEDRFFINTNSFADNLRLVWNGGNVLYIASFPDFYDLTDQYSEKHRGVFEREGFDIESWSVLDRRNADKAEELVKSADLIFLCGGHCMTEHKFYEELNLKHLLKGFDGVVIGVSAGSMNSAACVYAPAELEEELTDPDFVSRYEGLGLTDINIFPHYHLYKDSMLGGKRMMEDIVYPDSFGERFYCMPDGTYLMIKDGKSEIWGEYWLLSDGIIKKMQENTEVGIC